MNLYFLVEGEQTESRLYPQWLSYCLPNISQIDRYNQVCDDDFYLFSGGGIPSIYNHAVNAIQDINEAGGFDYLVICLDAEELSVDERRQKLLSYIDEKDVELREDCELKIIVHNSCIETWFLGNRNVYKRNPEGDLFREFSDFYNVELNDPELMQKYGSYNTTAQFHEAYLREMLKEYNVRYRKSRPKHVLKKTYFQRLQRRVGDEPGHLNSMQTFFDFMDELKDLSN